MKLDKKRSLALIHGKLDTLSKSIAELDKAYASKSAIEADLVELRRAETDLIADDSTKPAELVQHRAKIDLQAGKLSRATQAVLVAEETVSLDGETASVLIYAYKLASIDSYYKNLEAKTAAFFDAQDFGFVRSLAGRTSRARAIEAHVESHFSPRTPNHRAHDIDQARQLAGSFADLERATADFDPAIDIPESWAE